MAGAVDLYTLIASCTEGAADDAKMQEVIKRIRATETSELVRLIGMMSSDPGKKSRDIKALREAVLAEVDFKNAEMIAATMRSLQHAANRLTKWSVVVTVVGIFVGIVGIFIGVVGLASAAN